MKPKIEPFTILNAKGEKVGVMLKVEEFENIMKLLESISEVPETKETHQKVEAEIVSENEKDKIDYKKKKTKFIFGKTKAELDFDKSELAQDLEREEKEAEITTVPNNFYTKSIIGKPIHFEMQDEFCSAKGVLLADGKNFKVLKGSKASGIVDKDLSEEILYIREELKMLQVLKDDEVNGDLIFTRDYIFNNPTDAASTIAASPRDGRHYWISTENGKPMRQY